MGTSEAGPLWTGYQVSVQIGAEILLQLGSFLAISEDVLSYSID